MAVTKSPEEIFEGYDVLVGGIGSLSVEPFTDEEKALFDKFIDNAASTLSKVLPELGEDFKAQSGIFLKVGEIFKAKIKGKAFGGELPSSSQFGVGLIIPQILKYNSSPSSTYPCYTDYTTNTWNLSLTAGTTVNILGDGTNYYKASPTTDARAALCIMKNGFVSVGTTPGINQIQVRTEKVTYPPYPVAPFVDLEIEENYPVYRYNVPFNIPIFHDFGIRIDGMPVVTKTEELRLIGVAFYEYNFFSSLTYVT